MYSLRFNLFNIEHKHKNDDFLENTIKVKRRGEKLQNIFKF